MTHKLYSEHHETAKTKTRRIRHPYYVVTPSILKRQCEVYPGRSKSPRKRRDRTKSQPLSTTYLVLFRATQATWWGRLETRDFLKSKKCRWRILHSKRHSTMVTANDNSRAAAFTPGCENRTAVILLLLLLLYCCCALQFAHHSHVRCTTVVCVRFRTC